MTAASGSTAAAGNSSINYDAGPNPGIEIPTTIATHDREAMDSVLDVYDDNGDLTELPAHLNTSKDEQVELRFDKINDTDLREFPRKSDEDGDNSASAIDATEYTKSGQNSSDLTVSDETPHPGVEAVKFSTSGLGSGDTATASYSNFSIDDDPTKRVLLQILNVETLDSGTTVWINVSSTDGDHVAAKIESGATNDHEVVATSTGDGYVFQERINNMTVVSDGDGTIEDLQYLNYTIEGGDATITVTGSDAGRKSKLDLGTHYYDGPDDDSDEEEHEDVEDIDGSEQSGQVGLTSLSTLDSTFDDAQINDLQVNGAVFAAEDLDESEVSVEYSDAGDDYPGFDQTVEVFYRLELPQLIDVSYGSGTLKATQEFVNSRYVDVEYKEGTTEDFDEIDSWSDLSSSYSEKGDSHDLDTTVSAGTEYVYHAVIKLTEDDVSTLQDTSSSGGGAGPVDTGSNGFMGWLVGLFGMLAGVGSRIANWGPLRGFPWVV